MPTCLLFFTSLYFDVILNYPETTCLYTDRVAYCMGTSAVSLFCCKTFWWKSIKSWWADKLVLWEYPCFYLWVEEHEKLITYSKHLWYISICLAGQKSVYSKYRRKNTQIKYVRKYIWNHRLQWFISATHFVCLPETGLVF